MNNPAHSENAFPSKIPKQASGLLCPICNKFVDIESAKTDENGHVIHERLLAMTQKKRAKEMQKRSNEMRETVKAMQKSLGLNCKQPGPTEH